MKRIQVVALLAMIALITASVQAAVYIDDDFESYSDTAAMQAVWGAAGLGTLDTTNGLSPTQSMAHPAGAVNTFTLGADLIPSDTEPVVFRAAIYDAGNGNMRFSAGIRSLDTFPLFEMGHYNSGEAYYTRTTLFPGANPGWVPMPGTVAKTQGWHLWEATFTGTDVTVTLDLNSDGSIDSTQVTVLGAAYTTGLGKVQLGGPSGVGSLGGGGNFDDIYLAQIPEPATMAILGLGGLLLRSRRRR